MSAVGWLTTGRPARACEDAFPTLPKLPDSQEQLPFLFEASVLHAEPGNSSPWMPDTSLKQDMAARSAAGDRHGELHSQRGCCAVAVFQCALQLYCKTQPCSLEACTPAHLALTA